MSQGVSSWHMPDASELQIKAILRVHCEFEIKTISNMYFFI